MTTLAFLAGMGAGLALGIVLGGIVWPRVRRWWRETTYHHDPY